MLHDMACVMIDDRTIPSEAQCLTCGYLLRGLPEPKCPECGRPFDPLDATTFEGDSQRRRRILWAKRLAVAAGITLVVFALAPRELLTAKMVFSCSRCGATTIVYRWEPVPPGWIRASYPAFPWTSKTPAGAKFTNSACDVHQYDVSVRFDMRNGGWATGQGGYNRGEVVTFNDHPATLPKAMDVLEALSIPSNNGITVDYKPLP